MADELRDDSFDLALATMELPPEAKIPRAEKKQPETAVKQETTTAKRIAAANPHCIWVHSKQRGNPVLKSIQNVALEFRDDIIPDYVVGKTSCILYLSLKYHQLNPDYICQRIKELGNNYELRVLLVQVDIPEPFNVIKNLTRISLLTNLTFMLAWNADEAGKIIETYKLFEKRPPDLIMERAENDPHQKVIMNQISAIILYLMFAIISFCS